MPIYEYLCNSCGVKNEHMQKMSDAPIQACPECGGNDYNKLISAAGFQLKGTGWYATDFKDKPAQPGAKTNTANTGNTQSNPKNQNKTEKKSATENTSTSTSGNSTGSAPTAATTD